MRVDSLSKTTADVPCDFASKYDDYCRQFHLLPLSSVKIKLDSGIIDLDTDTLRSVISPFVSNRLDSFFAFSFDDWTPLCSAIATCKTLRSLTLRSQYYNSSSNTFVEGKSVDANGATRPRFFSRTSNGETLVLRLETSGPFSIERLIIEDLHAPQRLSLHHHRIERLGTRWTSTSTERFDDFSSSSKRLVERIRCTSVSLLSRGFGEMQIVGSFSSDQQSNRRRRTRQFVLGKDLFEKKKKKGE